MTTCYFCRGTVKSGRVTHVHLWEGRVIILEDVPADVCQQCGESYFAPDVLKAMDRIALGEGPAGPEKQVLVPVYSLSGL